MCSFHLGSGLAKVGAAMPDFTIMSKALKFLTGGEGAWCVFCTFQGLGRFFAFKILLWGLGLGSVWDPLGSWAGVVPGAELRHCRDFIKNKPF